MKFRFPIVIIDEDYRSENTSGLGIRALAQAIEKEGFEVLGVTSYGDLSQFAQQQSRASAFILSIDDEEFTPGPDLDPAVLNLRNFIEEVRRKNGCADLRLRRDQNQPAPAQRHAARAARLHSHVRGHAGVRGAPHHPRGQKLPGRRAAAVLQGLAGLRARRLLLLALPGHSGGVAFLKSPVGQMFHQFFGENMLRADVCNAVEELGQLLDHTGPVAPASATRRASSTPTTAFL
jgi:arginine decarboxylase